MAQTEPDGRLMLAVLFQSADVFVNGNVCVKGPDSRHRRLTLSDEGDVVELVSEIARKTRWELAWPSHRHPLKGLASRHLRERGRFGEKRRLVVLRLGTVEQEPTLIRIHAIGHGTGLPQRM